MSICAALALHLPRYHAETFTIELRLTRAVQQTPAHAADTTEVEE